MLCLGSEAWPARVRVGLYAMNISEFAPGCLGSLDPDGLGVLAGKWYKLPLPRTYARPTLAVCT